MGKSAFCIKNGECLHCELQEKMACRLALEQGAPVIHPDDGVTELRQGQATLTVPLSRLVQVVNLFPELKFERNTAVVPLPDVRHVHNTLLQHCLLHADDIIPERILELWHNMPSTKLEFSEERLQQELGDTWYTALHPFQRLSIRWLVTRGCGFLADEMGCGKTNQILAVCHCHRHMGPTLIVCPAILRHNWKCEILKWVPDTTPEQVYCVYQAKHVLQPKSRGKYALPPMEKLKFVVVSYSMLKSISSWLHEQHFRVVVLDESHYIKHRFSDRRKQVDALCQTAAHVFLLSGTPFSTSSEVFTQLQVIHRNLYPGFFDPSRVCHPDYFGSRYCEPAKVPSFAGYMQWEFRGNQKRDELNLVLAHVMLQRQKHQILTQLPPKNRIFVYLDPLKSSEEKEIKRVLDEGDRTSFMEAYRLTCAFKREAVRKYLEAEYFVERRVQELPFTLIFFHHQIMKDTLIDLMTKFCVPFFVIDGTTTNEKRIEYQEAFKNTFQYKVALLSIKAAGTGLTFTRASTVIFAEFLFGPEDLMQAEDRAHRMGQKSIVDVYYLSVPKSTDDLMLYLIEKKLRVASSLTQSKEDTSLKTLLIQKYRAEKERERNDAVQQLQQLSHPKPEPEEEQQAKRVKR